MSTIHEERARASLQAGLAVIPATLLYTEATLLPIASVFLSCSLPPPSPSPPSSTSTPHHHPPAAAASSSIWQKPSGQEYLGPTISTPVAGNNHSSVPRSHTTVADRMSPPVRVIITYHFPLCCRTGSVHVLLRTLEHQSAGGDGISVVNERESPVRKGNGRLSLISTVACVDMLTLLHSSASWLFQ